MFHVLGESVVDLVPDGHGGVRPTVGGSPLNVAVGLTRHGVPVRLWTALGDDEYGALVRDQVESLGLSIEVLPVERTGTARVRLDGGEPTYDLDVPAVLPAPDLSGARGLHVGSVSSLTEPGASVVRDAVAQAVTLGVPVNYDPNLRPGSGTRDDGTRDDGTRDAGTHAAAVRALAAQADTVRLSEDDARRLDPDTDPAETAEGLLTGRTTLVVLTRGADGATAYTVVNGLHVVSNVAAVPVEVIDTVGAGDAFTAGLLAYADRPIAERLHAAAQAAAACCARSGA